SVFNTTSFRYWRNKLRAWRQYKPIRSTGLSIKPPSRISNPFLFLSHNFCDLCHIGFYCSFSSWVCQRHKSHFVQISSRKTVSLRGSWRSFSNREGEIGGYQ